MKMNSSLEQARRLAPRWFDKEFMNSKERSFQEGLNIVFERQEDSLWNRYAKLYDTLLEVRSDSQ